MTERHIYIQYIHVHMHIPTHSHTTHMHKHPHTDTQTHALNAKHTQHTNTQKLGLVFRGWSCGGWQELVVLSQVVLLSLAGQRRAVGLHPGSLRGLRGDEGQKIKGNPNTKHKLKITNRTV